MKKTLERTMLFIFVTAIISSSVFSNSILAETETASTNYLLSTLAESKYDDGFEFCNSFIVFEGGKASKITASTKIYLASSSGEINEIDNTFGIETIDKYFYINNNTSGDQVEQLPIIRFTKGGKLGYAKINTNDASLEIYGDKVYNQIDLINANLFVAIEGNEAVIHKVDFANSVKTATQHDRIKAYDYSEYEDNKIVKENYVYYFDRCASGVVIGGIKEDDDGYESQDYLLLRISADDSIAKVAVPTNYSLSYSLNSYYSEDLICIKRNDDDFPEDVTYDERLNCYNYLNLSTGEKVLPKDYKDLTYYPAYGVYLASDGVRPEENVYSEYGVLDKKGNVLLSPYTYSRIDRYSLDEKAVLVTNDAVYDDDYNLIKPIQHGLFNFATKSLSVSMGQYDSPQLPATHKNEREDYFNYSSGMLRIRTEESVKKTGIEVSTKYRIVDANGKVVLDQTDKYAYIGLFSNNMFRYELETKTAKKDAINRVQAVKGILFNDYYGDFIPNTKVTLQQVTTNEEGEIIDGTVKKEFITDDMGRFEATDVEPGDYKISVTVKDKDNNDIEIVSERYVYNDDDDDDFDYYYEPFIYTIEEDCETYLDIFLDLENLIIDDVDYDYWYLKQYEYGAGYLDADGKDIFGKNFNDIQFSQDYNGIKLFNFYEDSGCGIIDINGNIVIEPNYVYVEYFDDSGYAIVQDAVDRFGVVTIDGEETFKPRVYYDIYSFSSGIFCVTDKNDKDSLIDYTGKEIGDKKFDYLGTMIQYDEFGQARYGKMYDMPHYATENGFCYLVTEAEKIGIIRVYRPMKVTLMQGDKTIEIKEVVFSNSLKGYKAPKQKNKVFIGLFSNKKLTNKVNLSKISIVENMTFFMKYVNLNAAPKKVKAVKAGSRKVKISWVKGKGTFEVMSSKKKNGKYKKIASVKKNSVTKKVAKSGTYFFKVKKLTKVNKVKVGGKFSKPVKVKV